MIQLLTENISALAKILIYELRTKNLKISFAESMTGGLLSSSLTKEKDASSIFELGFVTYSDKSKKDILKVKDKTLSNEGVYSLATVSEMLDGLKLKSEAEILVAVSGVAGPNASMGHSPGEVFIAIEINNIAFLYEKKFSGNREMVQLETVQFVFQEILNNLNE